MNKDNIEKEIKVIVNLINKYRENNIEEHLLLPFQFRLMQLIYNLDELTPLPKIGLQYHEVKIKK